MAIHPRFEPFLPTGSGSPEAPKFNLTVVPESEAKPLFKPAPVGKTLHANCDREAKPEVTLKREGDRITQIQVKCSCGQVIELDCQY